MSRPDLTNSDEILPLSRTVSEEEQRRAAAEDRAAQVTLADLALTVTGGDKAAAAEALREVLEAFKFIHYEPARIPTPDGCKKTITNYTRPGR